MSESITVEVTGADAAELKAAAKRMAEQFWGEETTSNRFSYDAINATPARIMGGPDDQVVPSWEATITVYRDSGRYAPEPAPGRRAYSPPPVQRGATW